MTTPELSVVKILLVDDEPNNLLALEAVLADEGRSLTRASSGPEALMYLLDQDFAVILLDVNMPGMDGFETAAMVRDREKTRDTPIIFLTAAIKGETYVNRGYALGAVDYIFKPFEPEILRSKVAVFVQLFRKTEEIKRQAQQLVESTLFLKSVLDSSTEYSIVALDLDGGVVAWNEGAHRMHGYSAQQIVGKQPYSIVFEGDALLPDLLERAAPTGTARGIFQLVRRNGEPFTASVVVDHRKDADGSAIGFVVITQDITERMHAEQEQLRLVEIETATAEAEVVRRRFAFLAEASRLLTASLDSDTTLAALTHYVVPVLADICIVDLVEDDSQDVHRVAVAGASSNGSDLTDRLRGIVPTLDQTCVGGRVTAGGQPAISVPLKTRGKTVGAMTLLSTDASHTYADAELELAGDLADRAAIALDNARLYGDAQRAIQLRDDFLSSASHDLKNPLTAIKGGADLLRKRASRSTDPETQRLGPMLARISQAATRMAALIDEILDVAQLKAGHQLELDRRSTDLVGLARETAHDFASDTDRVIDVESMVTDLVGHWDRARLERVIGNLLGNAVKFSPDGGAITLTLSCERSPERGWAVLLVQDHGIGIPEHELPRVFDRFYRGQNVIGKIHGTGIGLAGVRQIVEQHGGRVAVSSTEHEGTTISVRIPLD